MPDRGTTTKPSQGEEEYFVREDAEKKRRLALQFKKDTAADEQKRLKDLHFMHCPKCGHKLETMTYRGLAIDKCFSCNGTWLDAGELEALAGKEPGFLHSVVSLFKGEK
jgi:uncharacterized protein